MSSKDDCTHEPLSRRMQAHHDAGKTIHDTIPVCNACATKEENKLRLKILNAAVTSEIKIDACLMTVYTLWQSYPDLHPVIRARLDRLFDIMKMKDAEDFKGFE